MVCGERRHAARRREDHELSRERRGGRAHCARSRAAQAHLHSPRTGRSRVFQLLVVPNERARDRGPPNGAPARRATRKRPAGTSAIRTALLLFLARSVRGPAGAVFRSVSAGADSDPPVRGHWPPRREPRPTAAPVPWGQSASRRCTRRPRDQSVGEERHDVRRGNPPRAACALCRAQPPPGGDARAGFRDVARVRSDSLVSVRITSVGNRSRAAWAEGMRVHLPASLLDRTGWRRALRPNGDLEIPADAAPISDHDVAGLRERRAFTERPPLGARLPVSYRLAPGWARAMAASAIGRWNRHRADRWAAFPGWPIDLSTDVLDDLRDATVSPQPPSGRAPVVLTHDIDSPEGLKNLVARFLPLEEAVGARSTSYIVPCAWPLDHSLIAELVARGHEVGVHGYDHGNLTPFAAEGDRRRRLDA